MADRAAGAQGRRRGVLIHNVKTVWPAVESEFGVELKESIRNRSMVVFLEREQQRADAAFDLTLEYWQRHPESSHWICKAASNGPWPVRAFAKNSADTRARRAQRARERRAAGA